LSVQFVQQSTSKNGSRNSARPTATRAASRYTADTSARSNQRFATPVGNDRIRWASSAKVKADTSMPRLRIIGGPPCHPSQTGPNHVNPVRTASSPSLRIGSTDVATSPPMISDRPATTTRAAVAPERPE
jgi:hypothetical protein